MVTLNKALKKVVAARQVLADRADQLLNTEMTDDGFVRPDLAMRARMNDFGIGFDDGEPGDLMEGF